MHTPQAPFAESNLALLIMAVKRQIKQMGRTAGLKRFDLTDQQCLVLETVREVGPLCLGDLAATLHLDHPTASRLVHSLEKRCLLKVHLDPEQRRRVLIRRDESSLPFLEDLHNTLQAYDARFEEGLSETERVLLRDCLSRVLANLKAVEQELRIKDERSA